MARAFEPVIVVEEAHQQILNLHQTKRVARYVQRFHELLYKIPSMTVEEERQKILNLRQIRRVAGYVQRFRGLQYKYQQ